MSRDTVESHERFKESLELPFPLLADTKEQLCNAYGTLYERTDDDGSKRMSVQRSTFLIDPAGIIRHVWPKVSVPGHAADVLATFKALASPKTQPKS